MSWTGQLLERYLDIRRQEFGRVLLMSSYLLLVIAAYTVAKAVRDSLFVTKIGPAQLPYVYLLIAAAMGLVSFLHSKAVNRIGLRRLIQMTSSFAISNLVLFWVVFRYESAAWFYLLYVWASVFGAITASQFWLLATHVFNPREARRVFSWIGVGGILGGILGGGLTNRMVHWFGTEALLIVCATMMFATLVLLKQICRRSEDAVFASESPVSRSPSRRPSREDQPEGSGRALYHQVRESRHLSAMVVLLTIAVIVEAFIDYEYKLVAQQSIASKDHLTAFFGAITFYGGIVSLLFQLLLTNRILKRFGVGWAIQLLPAGLLAAFLTLAIRPALGTAAALQLIDGAFSYSVHRSGMELLYLPIPPKTRNAVKGFIDMFVDRTGRAAGALLLLLCTAALALSIPSLSLIAVGLVVAWLVMGVAVKREYLHSFRLALEKKTIEPDALQLDSVGGATMKSLLELMSSDDDRQILYALDLVSNVHPSRWRAQVDRLMHHPSSAIRARTVAALARWNDPAIVRDEFIHHEDYETARIAMASALRLQWTGLRKDRELLTSLLEDTSVAVVREAVTTAGMVRYTDAIPGLIAKLADRRLRRGVRQALLNLGSSAIPELVNRLSDTAEREEIRIRIPKTLALTGTPEAADALLRNLYRFNHELDYLILKALNRMRMNSPDIALPAEPVRIAIETEHREYNQLENLYLWFEANRINDTVFALLLRALQERLEHRRERLFRFLGLIYSPRDIYSVYYNYRSNPTLRPAAIEFLDNILDAQLKQTVVPLLEETFPGPPRVQFISFDAALSALLTIDDRWLKTIGAAVSVRLNRPRPAPRSASPIGRSLKKRSASPIGRSLKKTRFRGRRVVKASACALEEPMEERTAELSPVDKVVCLQSVDVFKYATTEMLAYVGSIAHEEFVVKGQVIFTEDEISEAMYVVVSGGVRVDRAGIEILNVGPGQSFGTWGLFDNQPRKMTATTLEDTRLLKIRSDDFYDLLADHDEITPAVFKAVIERVNRLIED